MDDTGLDRLAGSDWDRQLGRVILAAAAFVIFCIFMPTLAGLAYLQQDLGTYNLPVRFFYAQAIASGQDFTWCPSIWCGYYLHGEGQVGMYHPVHWLLYRCLPLSLAFGCELILAYPFMMAGMYLLLRCHRLPFSAAAVGASLFTLCGFNVLHFIHPNAVAVISHIPWLLAQYEGLAASVTGPYGVGLRRSWRLATIALLTASQLLLGYPQYVWISLLGEGLWVAFLAWRTWSVNWLFLVAWAKLLGLLLGAVQLLPTLDMLLNSERAAPEEYFRLGGSLHPINLFQFLAPYWFKHRVYSPVGFQGWQTQEYGIYMGSIAVLLVVVALMSSTDRARFQSLTFCCIVCVVVGGCLSFGQYLPGYRFLSSLPPLSLFRCPCRHVVLLALGLAGLASVGWQCLMRLSCPGHGVSSGGRPTGDTEAAQEQEGDGSGGSARGGEQAPCVRRGVEDDVGLRLKVGFVARLLLIAVAAIALGLKVWCKIDSDSVLRGIVGSTGHVLAGVLLLAVAVRLLVMAVNGRRWAVAVLGPFGVLELGIYGLSALWSYWPDSPTSIARFLADAKRPRGGWQGRVVGPNRLIMTGAALATGYVGLLPRRCLDYGQPAALRLAGVRWLYERDGKRRQLDDALPRAWLTTDVARLKQLMHQALKSGRNRTAATERPCRQSWRRGNARVGQWASAHRDGN